MQESLLLTIGESSMASGAQSFIASFRQLYEAATGNLQDHQWLNTYYVRGISQILVTRIRPIRDNDEILMLDGFDLSGNVCTLVAHVASLDLLMKLEDKEENKVYERVRIGFLD